MRRPGERGAEPEAARRRRGTVASLLTVGVDGPSIGSVEAPDVSCGAGGASARSGARPGGAGGAGAVDVRPDAPAPASGFAEAAPASPGAVWPASKAAVVGVAEVLAEGAGGVTADRCRYSPALLPGTTGSTGRAVGGVGAVTNDRATTCSGTTGSCGNARPVGPTGAGGSASVRCKGVAPRVGAAATGSPASATERWAASGVLPVSPGRWGIAGSDDLVADGPESADPANGLAANGSDPTVRTGRFGPGRFVPRWSGVGGFGERSRDEWFGFRWFGPGRFGS